MTDILWMLVLGLCLCMGAMVFAKPLRVLLRMLGSAIVGGLCLWGCQWMGIGVGLNVLTVGIVGILGIPGFLGLCIFAYFLG